MQGESREGCFQATLSAYEVWGGGEAGKGEHIRA